MISLAKTPASGLAPSVPAAPNLLTRFRQHLAGLTAAHEGQARLTALTSEMLKDSGLSPEDLTGAPSHDPALPFFMQASFRRNDR